MSEQEKHLTSQEKKCEEMIAEYEMLRQRTGAVRGEARVREDELRDYGVDGDDLDRLVALEQQIEKECETFTSVDEHEPTEAYSDDYSDSIDPDER